MARRKARKTADKVVRLRHTTRVGDWRMYFYDGELSVEDSVLTIPADRPEWVRRAWIQGFRMTVDGRVIANLDLHIRAETGEQPEAPAPEAENAESDEENDDEGAADRGQPVEDDGVRQGESDRDGSLPEGGDDGSGGDEPADEGDGDESAD